MTRRSLLSNSLVLPLAAAAAGARLKIDAVKAYPVPLLPTSRFGTAKFTSDYDPARYRWFGPFSQLSGSIVVEIKTGQGITGYGLGGGGGAGAYIVNNHLKDLLLGANALNIELLWNQMFASTSFYGRRGLAVMAISGIDLALWDISAKHAGRPVYQMLGGAVREKVPAYSTGHDMAQAKTLGFRAFKLPVEEGPADGGGSKQRIRERVIEARKIVGPDALLMIDCLARWNVEYTLEMADLLADANLHWIEEPLYPDDLAGYERLCAGVKGVKIASGEHEFTQYGFSELLRRNAVHILQPDLTWTGGLTAARKIAVMAAERGLPVIPHRGGSVFGLSLILATPNCPLAESFGTGENGNELMAAMTARFENGFYYPSDKPGFGVELSESMLKKYGA